MQIQDKTTILEGPSRVSMDPRKVKQQPNYVADKVELSKNIQAFDNKPRAVENKKAEVLSERIGTTLTVSEMIYDSTYNKAGKLLGLDSIPDWNKNSDKVYNIVETAKRKLNTKDSDKILPWIYKMSNLAPAITNRKLDDLNIYLKMDVGEQRPPVKVVTKTVVKYIKPKKHTR